MTTINIMPVYDLQVLDVGQVFRDKIKPKIHTCNKYHIWTSHTVNCIPEL